MRDLIATYRLQLGQQFGFAEVQRLLPYFESLGISHLYLSPIWQARAGSTHGYDVVNPAHISEQLGGEQRFIELADSNIGIIVDVVPNHMAIDASNPYWNDSRLRNRFFDIDAASGFHRRFFDVDDLVGVRVEDLEVFEATHRKVKELISRGAVDGLRIDHIDGLADPTAYLQRLAEFGCEHIWVEKILESGEELRSWPVEGTTGYDFLNDVTALFVEPSSEATLTELSGESRSFAEVAHQAKLELVTSTFTPELARLQTLFDVPEVAPALAALSVYRTYVVPGADIDGADRQAISRLPEPVRAEFARSDEISREFIVRFQQTTPAVMAKGVEDTALYRYVRLLALNEVGGDPQRFGRSIEEFHLANSRRNIRFPRAMLASQTHDTKRSGDVRARLVALSYYPDEWLELVRQWHQLSSGWRLDSAPDWTEELFIYQTLISGWPIGVDRLSPYLRKALREAKRNTNWIEPDETWEAQVISFCARLRDDGAFLRTFTPFAERVAIAGERITIAQLVLRMTSPGIPDIYQGDETWNYSFVDPDNRRPVDWDSAVGSLGEIASGVAPMQRANVKLAVTKIMLDLRRRHQRAFCGSYEPIDASPTTCAYRRGDDVIVAAAVRSDPISIELPRGNWVDVLELLGEIYGSSPVAVFERVRQ